MSSQGIQRALDKALSGYTLGVPIRVETIARTLGIEIIETPFAENPDLSGMLVREQERTFMAINEIQSPRRKRFTVAHEVGHFLLDAGKAIWIDNGASLISYRRPSGVGTPVNYRLEEVRANRFAARLLMPDKDVEDRFNKLTEEGVDWEDAPPLMTIAREFDVSLQAMSIRLRELGLLTIPGYD